MKTTGAAYFWWIIGCHYFYLGKPMTNIVYWLTLGGVGVWWIASLFLIPVHVEAANRRFVEKQVKWSEKAKTKLQGVN